MQMLHTVSNWKTFLDEIDRVLKPQGFYLNAQWITPPARMEFEGYFKAILSKYKAGETSRQLNRAIQEINVKEHFHSKGYRYQSSYMIVKKWVVSNTVRELLSFFKSRAYGLCWRIPDEIFHRVMAEFEEFCAEYYNSLEAELSSEAKFEIWAYTAS